jgi:hypothetical protein
MINLKSAAISFLLDYSKAMMQLVGESMKLMRAQMGEPMEVDRGKVKIKGR